MTQSTLIILLLIVIVAVLGAGFIFVVISMRRLERLQKRQHRRLTDLFAAIAVDPIRRALLADRRYADPRSLARYGHRIYSQNDEDGIIAEIFRRIGASTRRFLEIGAGDGLENNTLALLIQGWSGTWVEGSPRNAAKVRARYSALSDQGQLTLIERFVSLETIGAILAEAGGAESLDLLSIDIDGNDYHILKAMPLAARVVVAEYNARFAPPIDWVMPYDATHRWDGSDRYGASLTAFTALMKEKGYSLVGCNLSGVNAFFVRNDLVGDNFLAPYTAETHYEPARYWLMGGALTEGHRRNYRPQ